MTDEVLVGYLQTAVGLLVFGLGMPAYVFQVIVPEEVKQVIRKNRMLASWDIFIMAGLYFTSIAFFSYLAWNSTAAKIGYNVFIAHTILITTVGATIWFWWYQSSRPVLAAVVGRLRHSMRCGIDWHGAFPLPPLEDLVSIGRAAEDRNDRILVLNTIDEIVRIVQARYGYKGNGLESIIGGIESIVFTCQNDDQSLLSAVRILERIVRTAEARGLHARADVHLTVSALRRITVTALSSPRKPVGFIIAGKMAHNDGYENYVGVFEVGTCAIDSGNFLIASEALNFLESRVEECRFSNDITALCLMGLIAHWWIRGGECRKVALNSLDKTWSGQNIEHYMTAASDFFGEALDFKTVDYLQRLIAEVTIRHN